MALGVQIIMTEFHLIRSKIPSGDYAYGLKHFKIFRGGTPMKFASCSIGLEKKTNRWEFKRVHFASTCPYQPRYDLKMEL